MDYNRFGDDINRFLFRYNVVLVNGSLGGGGGDVDGSCLALTSLQIIIIVTWKEEDSLNEVID